jgi:hypothetical protein
MRERYALEKFLRLEKETLADMKQRLQTGEAAQPEAVISESPVPATAKPVARHERPDVAPKEPPPRTRPSGRKSCPRPPRTPTNWRRIVEAPEAQRQKSGFR